MLIQQQEFFPYANLMFSIYEDLSKRRRDYPLPHIGELILDVWEGLDLVFKDDVINGAIERNEHEEIFGMSRRDFEDLAYKGRIQGLELPQLTRSAVECELYGYLRINRLSFMEYSGAIMNSPFGKGVW